MFNKHRKHSGFLNRPVAKIKRFARYKIMSRCLWGGKSKKLRVLLNMYTNSTHYVEIEFSTPLFLLPKPTMPCWNSLQYHLMSLIFLFSLLLSKLSVCSIYMMICDPISLQKNLKRGNLVKTSNCFEVWVVWVVTSWTRGDQWTIEAGAGPLPLGKRIGGICIECCCE